ncbi:myeloid leukemia factor [Haloarcula marina]|uniref:myeloid leukemia factor n=1 Tax=Haloarcula marina TaxID=2961574 RepID=UPI0020B7FC2C|nr:myeloid leukemia factor [Halomicroarcula marina]
MIVVDASRTYADYDSFARRWHSETLDARGVSLEAARERGLINEQDTHRLWQLLGLLNEDDVFIQLPEWLVDEKTGDVRENPATTFVGYISRETEDAILFKDSAPGRRLMQVAHKIHSLEHGIETTAVDSDRRKRLNDKLQEEHQRFEMRDDAPYLSDEWLPKSQLITIIR